MARDRSGLDSAGVGPDPASAARLQRLSDLRDLDVALDDPDIRGWEVRTVSGRRLGRVDDLLVDEERREVVMLDVDLHDSDRHVEVPIRSAQIDRTRHHVIVDTADTEPLGEADDRAVQERLAERHRRELADRERSDLAERERIDRMDRMSAEDRLRAAERMRGERTMRGETTVREQGRPRHAAPAGPEVEEVVVEERPVVMEETVVRRRPVGEEDLDRDRSA